MQAVGGGRLADMGYAVGKVRGGNGVNRRFARTAGMDNTSIAQKFEEVVNKCSNICSNRLKGEYGSKWVRNLIAAGGSRTFLQWTGADLNVNWRVDVSGPDYFPADADIPIWL